MNNSNNTETNLTLQHFHSHRVGAAAFADAVDGCFNYFSKGTVSQNFPYVRRKNRKGEKNNTV